MPTDCSDRQIGYANTRREVVALHAKKHRHRASSGRPLPTVLHCDLLFKLFKFKWLLAVFNGTI